MFLQHQRSATTNNNRGDYAFEIHSNQIKFGPGVLQEVGFDALELGLAGKRVLIFTDANLVKIGGYVQTVKDSLLKYGKVAHVDIYDQVEVEPTDVSFKRAIQFCKENRYDGYLSVGGGSVMDTCKAANLYSTYEPPQGDYDPLLYYVNAPIGLGNPCPGPLKPHIACPTTSGTGSEATGFSIFDLLSMKAKTGIADRYLRPDRALVDPLTTITLPANVVAASGFDTLSHGLESYTAISYKERKNYPFQLGKHRPQNQGSNPFADFGCLEALRIVNDNIARAVNDKDDYEAREKMMFASTLAGAAMGSAGVHLPHGMSYAVTGMNESYKCEGYPQDAPLIPHGISVILNAPSVFHYTAKHSPQRHINAARALNINDRKLTPDDVGLAIREKLIEYMKATNMPNGLSAVGFGSHHVSDLVSRTFPQKRVVNNAPFDVTEASLHEIFENAMKYW